MHWAMQSPGLPVFGGKPEEKNPKRAVTHCTEMHKFALQIYFLRFSLGNAHSCPRPRTGLTSPPSPSLALLF